MEIMRRIQKGRRGQRFAVRHGRVPGPVLLEAVAAERGVMTGAAMPMSS